MCSAMKTNACFALGENNFNFDTNIQFIQWENKKTYINLNIDSQLIKNLAIKLREIHQDALIIVGSKIDSKTVLAIASKIYNSKEIFDNLSVKFGGKGGGNSDFAMGSFNKIVVID